MAQIAIPLVIAGVLFLISNDKKESFNSYEEKDEIVKNSIEKTSIQTNNEGVYSQYQDKYVNRGNKQTSFVSLTGQKVDEFKHNNMNSFYNNKSNGEFSQGRYNKTDSTMDNYTGAGSLSINKEEVATFFKPQDNMQNVYGTQNQSDFMQSRVVQSQKFANTKPWEEIKVAPGTSGFNSGMERREQWIDKNVDELRAVNNPKANNPTNYVPPAYKMGDRGIQGKVIKKSPEKFHVNNEIKGNALGMLRPTQNSEQMLTDENRDHTSVSYFGTRTSDTAGYVKGSYDQPHKPELPTNPYLNLTSTDVFPTNEQNYGKSSYKSYNNNRNSNNENEYMGAVKGLFMANVVNPIVNGLKHTKKEDLVKNHFNGNLSASVKPTVNPEYKIPATNRQIQADRIGTNYLQMNRQNSDGYMTANPYLIGQQRETTDSSYIGNAGGLSGAKSYNAEYNQRDFYKPIENRIAMGNSNVFNNKINATITGTEQANNRSQAVYRPSIVQQIGMNTTAPQEYRNMNDDYLQADMLKAFKQNPYTQPIGSVA